MKFQNSFVGAAFLGATMMPVALSTLVLMAAMASPAMAESSTATENHNSDVPQSGRDYHSIQIASSPSRVVLERQFSRYARLPFVRIEQRGSLYVLRAGFWTKAETAQVVGATHAEILGIAPLVRVATYRPETVRQGNWPGASAAFQAQTREQSIPPALTQSRVPSPTSSTPATLSETSLSPTSTARNQNQNQNLSPLNQSQTPLTEKPPQGMAAMKPYDAEDYTLAFDAFLGGGDRERAFLVASKAVESVPEDLEWRRKLARVAEWTQRPTIAWTQWSMLYRQGDRSTETQTAVLRLAPFFDDPVAAIEVWKNRVQGEGGRTLTDAQWQDIYHLFESASQPRVGSLFFEQQYRRLGKVKLLEYAAQEAEYGGDDDRALLLYGERVRAEPFSQDACLRAAIILLRRDREREAYTLLEAQRARAEQKDVAYWGLLTNMALNLAELKTAESAMQQLNAGKEPERADWDRLITLLRIEHPARAADLSLERYRRTGQARFFIMALEFYSQTENRPMQTRLLEGISAEARSDFEKNPHFLRLRARYYQLSRDKADVARAWNDLQQALVLQPKDTPTIVAVLWFLLDQHRLAELSPLLDRYAAQAEQDSAYWLLYAAAYHGMDQYRHALPWYRKEIERTPDDNLLLLNYADLLERLQQPGMAERVRRHAWLRLQEKFPQPSLSAPLDAQPELLALARLALQNNPGDPGAALVRKLVSELRGVPESAPIEVQAGVPASQNESSPPDQQTRDLILGWAISHEQHPQAREWMWFNQVRSQSVQGSYRAPLWGEAQAALQVNDTQLMDKLLLTQGQALPIYNRYDIAHALEHWPQAQDIAFHGMNDNEVDEELYDRYRQHVPRHVNHVQWRTTQGRYGALDSREQRIDAHLVVTRRLHLDLGWEGFSQSSHDATLNAPPRERLSRVGVQWLGTYGDTSLSLFHRDELTGRTGWRAAQTWTWDRRLNLNGMAEYRGAATDSLPLRIYGYQNSVSVGANYALSRREYLAATQRLSRYYTQRDDALGRSRTLDVEAGYRWRLEYPDWRTRLYATSQSFSYDGNVSSRTRASLAPSVQMAMAMANGSLDAVRYFLPQGSTTVGACLGMGENLAGQNMQETYTRAWRPYYDVCANHNNMNGTGYSGYIGMAGSVDGEDHLALRIEQSSGGTGTGALSRALSARYRHYF